jgi:uncharacterized protein
MDRFWRMVAHHHGQLLNLSALGVTHPSVRARLDAMVGAFMLRLLPPLEANPGKRLVRTPKIFVQVILRSVTALPSCVPSRTRLPASIAEAK